MSEEDPALYSAPLVITLADAQPGDLVFCHRKGWASWCIRTGERLRWKRAAEWSHVAGVARDGRLIEALTHGVVKTPREVYAKVEVEVVRPHLYGKSDVDLEQALAFAESCVGQRYGFGTDIGIGLRFLVPWGRGLWFGMNGTEICSGLWAQALVRGWYNFETNPASMLPSELYAELTGIRATL